MGGGWWVVGGGWWVVGSGWGGVGGGWWVLGGGWLAALQQKLGYDTEQNLETNRGETRGKKKRTVEAIMRMDGPHFRGCNASCLALPQP